MEKSIFEYAKKPVLIFAFRFNIFLKTGVFSFFCPPPLVLCSNGSFMGLKLARLAIIVDQYILENEFADSLTPAFTHPLLCFPQLLEYCHRNTHFYWRIKLPFDPDLPSICLVMKVYEVDACLHICSPS